jgi:hypothetical protein
VIALLDTSHDLEQAAKELGHPVEQLLTPLSRFKRRNKKAHYAIDNGTFSRFNRQAFEALLDRESDARKLCRFVAVPDVVGNARRTLEVFEYWRYKLCGWKLALVAQDGQGELPIPWEGIDAIFIGGSTKWKLGEDAKAICKAAKAMSKWVHIGRVNGKDRFRYAKWQLEADSVDGMGLSKYSHMRKAIAQPTLYDEANLVLASGEEKE